MKMVLGTRFGWIPAVAIALAACHDEPETTCGEGTELVARRCVPLGGGSDAGRPSGDAGEQRECGEGTRATEDGTCVALLPIGAACASGAECASGTCLGEDRGAVGGYCTITGCSDNRPCPAGSHCTFASRDETTLCLAYCDADDDCRADDYACQPLYTTDVRVCAPSCVHTGACPSGATCDEDSGKCVPHACELGAEDACGSADSGLLCLPDRRGLTETGGICLVECDPAEPTATCASNEVCQPLPEATDRGFCAPPLCATSEDCPAGSLCQEGVCQPPPSCDEDGECADDLVCVGGPGGRCMPACPSEGACSDLHSGLSCAASLGACLPTGSFPGSACRNVLDAPCDPLTVQRDDDTTSTTPMVCQDGICLATCDDGGSELCGDIAATLTCAEDVYATPVCLPAGSFPGGPCDADDECAPLAHGGASLPMVCENARCLITCDDADGGDVLCESVDASLLCVSGLFDDDVCLPRGSIPGGPCAAGNSCATGMVCEGDMCLYDCSTGGQAVCDAVSTTLACATTVYATPVCLPKGSFPGGPCDAANQCAQDLGGLGAADMFCSDGRCLVQCGALGPFASGDALCGTVNPALTCVQSPVGTDFCAPACVSDACPTGSSCLTSQNACLPTGSFLGSPCAEDNTCDGDPMLACVPGVNTCAAQCAVAEAPSTYCTALNAALGTTFDSCVDADQGGPGSLLICMDAIP